MAPQGKWRRKGGHSALTELGTAGSCLDMLSLWDMRLPKGSPWDEESLMVVSGGVMIFPTPFARLFSSSYTSCPLGFHLNLPGFVKQQVKGWQDSIPALTSNKSELSTS